MSPLSKPLLSKITIFILVYLLSIGSIFSQNLFSFGNTEEILDPEQAFVIQTRVDQPNELTVSWIIEDGYYLYKDKFLFSPDNQIQLGTPSFSSSTFNFDEFFGNVEVHYNYAEIKIPFSRISPQELNSVLKINYQGCKKDSICYPPIEKNINLIIPSIYSFDLSSYERPVISEQDRLKEMIMSGPFWLVLLTFYGFGLLLSFTPCVLPLMPIVSGIIVGQKKNISTLEAFILSVTYVMGMCFTYTIGGAIAATLGYQLQAAFQEPWLIISFSLVFLLLALSMFDFFEIALPSRVNSFINNIINTQKKGTLLGTFSIGVLSALIVTTCIAPPLVATLAVISQNGDVIKGSISLFSLSLGMGTPLIIIGTTAGKFLPRSGPWMIYIKKVFGFFILALAIWMLERVTPNNIIITLWAMLILFAGISMGTNLNKKIKSSSNYIFGILGLIACLYSLSIITGQFLSTKNPFIPSELFKANNQNITTEEKLEFKSIISTNHLEENIKNAVTLEKPIMLELTAEWCITCKEIERYTFSDEEVVNKTKDFILLQIDVTNNTNSDKNLLKELNSFGPPTIIFYNKEGNEIAGLRTVGFISKEELIQKLNYLTEI